MKVELFPFQKKAVKELRKSVADALDFYRNKGRPQVISLQAPTGAGKTIIMSALIEDIYYGTEEYEEQPNAIFVWLSDSPSLNEQSKNKIDFKADKIKLSQCVVIEEKSFDAEMLADGHIYFLNTQKLSRSGKLGEKGDDREYPIWETMTNTAREKSDRLYFIIDEAQNLTPLEVKTIVTRAGEGTKIVLTGDIFQIDQPYLDQWSNGLTHTGEKMDGQKIFQHVFLRKGERSELSEIASKLL